MDEVRAQARGPGSDERRPPGAQSDAHPGAASDERWWRRLLARSSRIALVVALLPAALYLFVEPARRPALTAMVLVTLACLAAAGLARSLRARTRALLLIAPVAGLSALGTPEFGPTPVNVIAPVFAAFLALLAFGIRPALIVLGALTLVYVAGGYLAREHIAAMHPGRILRLDTWVRQGLTMAALGSFILLVGDASLRRLRRSLDRAQSRLARLRDEQAARAQAQGALARHETVEQARQRRMTEAQSVFLRLAESAALRAGNLPGTLAELTEAGTRLLDTRRCSVWRLEDDGRILRCLDLYDAQTGRHDATVALQADACPRYFSALRRERVLAAHDARADTRTSEFSDGYLVPMGITALLDAPVHLAGSMVGVLCLEHVGERPRAWTSEDETLAAQLADCASRALEAAARAEAARELARTSRELALLSDRLARAQEEERRQIARELHDELGQTLTAMKINLKLLGQPAPAAAAVPGDLPAVLADTLQLVDRTIATVRNLSHAMRPPLLDELGLLAALRAFVEELARRSGLTIHLDAPPQLPTLPADQSIALFRGVQEALTNVLRHARARTVWVRMHWVERADRSAGGEPSCAGRLRVSVEDDGQGFDPDRRLTEAAVGGHLGLVGMRERMRALGGEFRLSSRPGHGTRVDLELPVPDAPPPGEVGRRGADLRGVA